MKCQECGRRTRRGEGLDASDIHSILSDRLISKADDTPGLTPFQFHVWNTLAFFKAEQGDSFRYEYLYAQSPKVKESIETCIDGLAREIKEADFRKILVV